MSPSPQSEVSLLLSDARGLQLLQVMEEETGIIFVHGITFQLSEFFSSSVKGRVVYVMCN